MKKILLLVIVFAALGVYGFSAFNIGKIDKDQPFDVLKTQSREETRWVDSVYNSLSDREKIGQLFMLPAYPIQGDSDKYKVSSIIEKYKIGGLIMFKGDAYQLASLTNYYQGVSKTKLMVSIDGEWGIGMRVDNIMKYPRQLMLGAIQDNTLLYEMGKEVAEQCRRIGVHVNFAPVVDVNNNANNPVINDRSFGENRQNVSGKAFQYMLGMQDGDIIACAKHFPGHGDTETDSHKDLPVINQTSTRMDSMELYPFKVMIQHGIKSIMTGHLNIPSIDDTPNQPSTLSVKTVKELLKKTLGFKGLVFTDAMSMQGVAKYYKNGQAEVKALAAGNDVILMPSNIDETFAAVEAAITSGELNRDDLNQRVKKILHAKFKIGLNKYSPVSLDNLDADLRQNKSIALRQRLVESSLTLVKNKSELLPIKRMDTLNISSLALGSETINVFQRELLKYTGLACYNAPLDIPAVRQAEFLGKFSKKDYLILSLHGMTRKPDKNFGLTATTIDFIQRISVQTNVVLVIHGNPYCLKNFESNDWLLCAYEEDDMIQKASAQAIFGSVGCSGRLPITAAPSLPFGTGFDTNAFRLPYSEPESMGISSYALDKIDSIAEICISKKAAPGLQVLVAKDGKIIFHRAYGNHTYDNGVSVKTTNLYDLASVTKICCTTLCVMKLYEDGKLDLDKTIGDYIPELNQTNKGGLKIRNLLLHQAGLVAWIPFYQNTLNAAKKPDSKYYRYSPEEGYTVPVCNNFYMENKYVDTIWQRIYDSPLRGSTDYLYSDLSLLLTMKVVEKIAGKSLDQYADETFYKPMGLVYTGFNPYKRFDAYHVVPTEEDNYFRFQTIQGYVHDMGSAQLGGVAGHAGLFSTAQEIAAIMNMLISDGKHEGKQYLKPETINMFTRYYNTSASRRGIGFDKPEVNCANNCGSCNTSCKCSPNTFGHTGFTGICTWADPDLHLVYVFLSNRTYPDMNNKKLQSLDIRSKIQDIIYKAVTAPKMK